MCDIQRTFIIQSKNKKERYGINSEAGSGNRTNIKLHSYPNHQSYNYETLFVKLGYNFVNLVSGLCLTFHNENLVLSEFSKYNPKNLLKSSIETFKKEQKEKLKNVKSFLQEKFSIKKIGTSQTLINEDAILKIIEQQSILSYLSQNYDKFTPNKIAILTFGSSGSGKSYLLEKYTKHNKKMLHISNYKDFITIDYDNVGKTIIENQQNLRKTCDRHAYQKVYKVSGNVSELLFKQAIQYNCPIILQSITPNKKRVQILVEKGYTIYLFAVSKPNDKVAKQRYERLNKTGFYTKLNFVNEQQFVNSVKMILDVAKNNFKQIIINKNDQNKLFEPRSLLNKIKFTDK